MADTLTVEHPAPSEESPRRGQRVALHVDRPSTKYKRIDPPNRITLQRATSAPSPTLPRQQSPRTWRCSSTERFPLQSSVTGTARAGKAGELVSKNGDRYLGEVLAGRPHGHGQYMVIRGNRYEVQYEGEYQHGVRSGRGVFNYISGERYSGEFAWNKRHGRGRMEYLNGDAYDGEWEEDLRHGVGNYLYKNGDIFVGTYVRDKKEGLGTVFMVSRGKKYVSEYRKDAPQCGTVLDIEGEELSPLNQSLENTVRTAKRDQTMTLGKIPPLPELDVKQPYGLVLNEIARARKERSTDSKATRQVAKIGGTVGDVELALLRHSFTQLAGGDSLDVKLIPRELKDLCRLAGLDPSSSRTAKMMQEVLQERQRDGQVYLEDFLRVIAHFRGFTLETVDLGGFDSNSGDWGEESHWSDDH